MRTRTDRQRKTRATVVAVVAALVLAASPVVAQTAPTPAEIAQWRKEDVDPIETTNCKKLLWQMNEDKRVWPDRPSAFGLMVSWLGRGFIEGVITMMDDDASAKLVRFGLSADVVLAHVTTYCTAHDKNNTQGAVYDLFLKVVK